MKRVTAEYTGKVASQKKSAHNRLDILKKRLGQGRKIRRGRMHGPGSKQRQKCVKHFTEVVEENAFGAVMDYLKEEEVEMCVDVLRMAQINDFETTTETNLMPSVFKNEIEGIVARLKPLVSREACVLFSSGLAGVDGVRNATLGAQDLLGMMAGDAYMMTSMAPTGEMGEVLEVALPVVYKNDDALNPSVEGGECCHIKSPRMHKFLVAMLVILRPLMREHLKDLHPQRLKQDPDAEEYTLCPQIGPFNKNGKLFNNAQLLGLFQYLGEHLIALPKWGYNILRTASMTDTAFLALAKNDAVDAPWVLRRLAACRMSKDQYLRHYNATTARVLRFDKSTIDSVAVGFEGLHQLRRKENEDKSGASGLEAKKAADEIKQLTREREQQRERVQQLEGERTTASSIPGAAASTDHRRTRRISAGHQC